MPRKESAIEYVLKLFHLLAKRRLGNRKLARGPGKVTVSRYGEKVAYLPERYLADGEPCHCPHLYLIDDKL
jgi:hypothetical protein